MNRFIGFLGMIILLTSCAKTNTTMESKSLNSSPVTVMQAIFKAAQTGKVDQLPSLLPPKELGECNGDCKAICNPGNESMRKELAHNYTTVEQFKEYFAKAKIVGEPRIEGNKAHVDFLFGKDGTRKEIKTINLQKLKGKWYLESF
ncbi:MAG: hypothetical protein GY810_02830 [Aureispira sp.]|nr:hypothetical protein [Aureispira sp.]